MCKVKKNELAPKITANVFCTTPESYCNLRNHNDFRVTSEKLFTMALWACHIQDQKHEILFPLNLNKVNPLTFLKYQKENVYQTIALVQFVKCVCGIGFLGLFYINLTFKFLCIKYLCCFHYSVLIDLDQHVDTYSHVNIKLK